MKFKFKIQQYQTDAVESTVAVFAGQPAKARSQYRRDLGKIKKEKELFADEYVGYRNAEDGRGCSARHVLQGIA